MPDRAREIAPEKSIGVAEYGVGSGNSVIRLRGVRPVIPTEAEEEDARRCLAEIHADPLRRGQPQRTTDQWELGPDDPPPPIVLYWARVSPTTNLGVFYAVNTDTMFVTFADIGP